jgi:hypothetical protein
VPPIYAYYIRVYAYYMSKHVLYTRRRVLIGCRDETSRACAYAIKNRIKIKSFRRHLKRGLLQSQKRPYYNQQIPYYKGMCAPSAAKRPRAPMPSNRIKIKSGSHGPRTQVDTAHEAANVWRARASEVRAHAALKRSLSKERDVLVSKVTYYSVKRDLLPVKGLLCLLQLVSFDFGSLSARNDLKGIRV